MSFPSWVVMWFSVTLLMLTHEACGQQKPCQDIDASRYGTMTVQRLEGMQRDCELTSGAWGLYNGFERASAFTVLGIVRFVLAEKINDPSLLEKGVDALSKALQLFDDPGYRAYVLVTRSLIYAQMKEWRKGRADVEAAKNYFEGRSSLPQKLRKDAQEVMTWPEPKRPPPKEDSPRENPSAGQTHILSCRKGGSVFGEMINLPTPLTLELNLTKKQITGMQTPEQKDMVKINPIPLRISSQTIEWELGEGKDKDVFILQRDSLDIYLVYNGVRDHAERIYNCRQRSL